MNLTSKAERLQPLLSAGWFFAIHMSRQFSRIGDSGVPSIEKANIAAQESSLTRTLCTRRCTKGRAEGAAFIFVANPDGLRAEFMDNGVKKKP